MSKKIGILTYYWPPAGGSGVQRWLRFSNELAKLGHDIHVFTFKNPKYPIVDKELLNKVDSKVKVNFISGFELPNFLTNKNSNSAESFKSSGVKSFVRELFFFPDSRKYLIPPSVKYIKKYIKKTPLNCLITSGPPHSMHLVGLKLKKTTNLKWIADFRDPWSNFIQNKFLNKLESTKIKHEKKENLVLKFSDAVLTTSKSLNK
ncbi:MAG: glycosyl transferase family 1, partial [Flavobacteriaceae bacterium]